MAELTQKERLQPSLLDRLIDDQPGEGRESRDKRVLSLRRLRQSVIRDLDWLLNSSNLTSTQDLEDYPLVAQSVLNFGLPDLAGRTVASTDGAAIERLLRQAIWDFEPRILRNSVEVRILVEESVHSHNTLTIEIEGDLWAQPLPVRLYLKTEVDLETGTASIAEYAGPGAT